MSTMVAIPVRVEPPPAELGETISPTCASLETTMPAKGARTVQLSRSCWATRIFASEAWTCPLVMAIFARRLSAVVRALSSASGLLTRSEEHTSELQSQFHLVCRLLLEKKK